MPLQTDCDISIVITAHNEGILAHRTLGSAVAAVEHAKKAGIKCEIIVVQDCPTLETQKYFQSQELFEIRSLAVDHQDPGLSRNSGVEESQATYIAFLDADDLYSKEWLAGAFHRAKSETTSEFVLHPQYTVVFEDAWCIQDHMSTGDKRFDWKNVIEGNLWTSLIFSPRSLLKRIPFSDSHGGTGFGYEDWHWVSRILSENVPVDVVKKTSCFVRRRISGSRLSRHNAAAALIRPTPFLNPSKVCEQNKSEKDSSNTATKRKPRRILRFWNSALRQTQTKIPRASSLVRFAHDLFLKIDARRNRVRKLPQSLESQWRDLHTIEPQLFPDSWSMWKYSWAEVKYPEVGAAYVDLCESAKAQASHVFLVPAVRRGGADVVLLNFLKALTQHALANGITVIATSDADSTWQKRLPPSVNFIEFGKITRKLFQQQKEFLLATLLVQSRPKVIHNMNSSEGYQVLRRYGKALAQHSRLFASVYSESISDSGREFGYPLDDLPYCYEYLTGVFTDNRRFVEKLCSLFAFEADRFQVCYQPVNVLKRSPSEANRDKLDVLWASRLDREKRPDLLLRIAQRCADLPIHFHVFGKAVLGKDSITKKLKRLRNATYHGPFDGFDSLHSERFDLFLYTSQSDGMPNVVLEAMAAGLPVIASDVGGLREVIAHSETGWLISPFDDVEQFADTLEHVAADRGPLRRVAELGQQKVSIQHSWEQFVDALRQSTAYLEKPEIGLDKRMD